MKIISLNTWGGRAGHKEFLDFIKKHADTTDVFCLQEVWQLEENKREVHALLKDAVVGGVVLRNMMEDLFDQVGSVLPDHIGFFHPHYGDHYGLAMFVKKNLEVVSSGDVFVFKDREFVPTGDVGNHARNIEYATLRTDKGPLTVINFHGLWNGKGKTDTEDRLLQSENIIKFLKTVENPFVLCGDFNLLPDTESLKMFERFGLKNLIADFGITSTRTSLYKKEHRLADYVFVSEGVKVNDFKVLPDEVSDHNALYIDIL